MERSEKWDGTHSSPVSNSAAVTSHFRHELLSGKHWYLALLESIGLWTDETEEYQGQSYCYLIDDEAFDWLLLAGRLCGSVNGLVPENEKCALLFRGKPPWSLPRGEFKNLIGKNKYRQYLNFFYGITVEEALLQAVREEVRKECSANGLIYRRDEEKETFLRIYAETEAGLLKQFRKDKSYPRLSSLNITQMKEFTYWRFKYRVKTGEKAKVASDTHKGLMWLDKNRSCVLT